MNIVGPIVKEIREKQRLTQEALSARCNLLGWDISRSTLAKIEVQLRRVKDTEAAMLAMALKVDISDVYRGTALLSDEIAQLQKSPS